MSNIVAGSELAILDGERAIKSDPGDMFTWPIVTEEMEDAVLKVLRAGNMSGWDVTEKFEREFADWHGIEYGLAANTGTAALQCAMFGLGIGKGDEIICPSVTYWASCLQVYSLGGTVVFADVHPETLCLDPDDIEHRITDRTRALVVVHYCGHPADMDPIMSIARKHNLKVIEDVSHAHGALYKGRMVGTFGDASGFSLMSGKSFAVGEGGILLTNDQVVYERAMAFGYYEKAGELTIPELQAGAGLPWGGQKFRMNQLSSAVGLVQIRKYPREMAEIDSAMNHYWDTLEGTPGVRAVRPPKGSGSTMGGWYASLGRYVSEELGGLSISRFCEALTAEGITTSPGCNKALHLHPLFSSIDVYGDGRPTRIANSTRDVREPRGSLPVSESIQSKVFRSPWFKHYRPEIIEEYAAAVRKVADNYRDLIPGDIEGSEDVGGWGLTFSGS